MSRVGKKIISIPNGVKVEHKGKNISITGPKGILQFDIHDYASLDIKPDSIEVKVPLPENKKQKALWGTTRAIIANMVEGVTKGFEKKLEINGVGFKVQLTGKTLTFALGFSHPIVVDVPVGLTAAVDKNLITISGSDKQQVGQFAAQIRELKKPEPYKGKGIKYIDETILRKAGKVMKAVGK